jgi:predicted NBD/HSP70 family sugar kinase
VPFAVGLDLGGTDLKSARVYADGRLEEFGKRPSRAAESADAPIEAMTEAFADLTRGRAGCIGVGVGSPGVIDPVTGHAGNRRTSTGVHSRSSRAGCPVLVSHHGRQRCQLAALRRAATARPRASVSITITIGTGSAPASS